MSSAHASRTPRRHSRRPASWSNASPLPIVAPEPFELTAQRLLDRYDAVVADILTDPRVASDPVNPKVAAYLALFPKDSMFAANTVQVWAGEGTKGRFYKPGPGGAIVKSTLRQVTAQTADEATFAVCTKRSVQVVDAAGLPIEAVGGVTDGEVVAVKVVDTWLLQDLTQLATTVCPKPGAEG